MSVALVYFLLDEVVLDQAVRPAIEAFVSREQSAIARTLLRGAVEGAPSREHGGSLRSMTGAHLDQREALRYSRDVLAEMDEAERGGRPSSSQLAPMVAWALMQSVCIPWASSDSPTFRWDRTPLRGYLREHGIEGWELIESSEYRTLAPGFVIGVMSVAEARAWAKRLRELGPPAGAGDGATQARGDYERLLALFDVASREGRVRLALRAN